MAHSYNLYLCAEVGGWVRVTASEASSASAPAAPAPPTGRRRQLRPGQGAEEDLGAEEEEEELPTAMELRQALARLDALRAMPYPQGLTEDEFRAAVRAVNTSGCPLC